MTQRNVIIGAVAVIVVILVVGIAASGSGGGNSGSQKSGASALTDSSSCEQFNDASQSAENSFAEANNIDAGSIDTVCGFNGITGVAPTNLGAAVQAAQEMP